MKTINFEIEMANGRVMKGELYPEVAPKTVENFVGLINQHFFDELIFHRVIQGFMIQGGGYDAKMVHHDAPSIVGEFNSNGFTNPLLHERGVISMARTSDPNSASSQFFIMHANAPHLDGAYAAFGRITDGLDVVDDIAGVATNFMDAPLDPVVMKTIRLI